MLEIPADMIHTWETSTDAVANTVGTVGSMGSEVNGPAVVDACTQIRDRLRPYKASNPKGTWGDWVRAAWMDNVTLQAVGSYSSDCDYNADENSGKFAAFW